MKILFIGGTGNISSAVSRQVVAAGHELFLLNRGTRPMSIEGAQSLIADIKDEEAVKKVIAGQSFDVVANFIAFTEEDVARDRRLFEGQCGQYIFISSASAYQKPQCNPVITESTPLVNPHWQYSRNKIASELYLNQAYRDSGFPITIIRPSLTYDTVIPMAIGSWDDFTLVERMRRGEPIISHGDGSSLWTITHSEDFARGMVGLLGHQQAIGESFHITSDEILNWDQCYQALAAAIGVEANIIHIPSDFIVKMVPSQEGGLHGDKAVSVIFDNSKIKRFVPEFKAVIPFKVGIKRSVEWFEANPERKNLKPSTDKMLDAIIEKYNSVFANLQPL
ncbi:MAG: SDR family oxidoreductase [Planctomycetes bacterium]|nr:SDR family oxidoreductase [Planctomycetota bacterium]